MTVIEQTGAESVQWDLSDVYAGPEDERLEADLAEAQRAASAFRERYAGRVGELTPAELAEAVTELERIEGLEVRARAYAHMLFSEDTSNDVASALLARTQEIATRLDTELLFFRLEWSAVDDAAADAALADDALADRDHFLRSLRRFRPHLLSEPEERVLAETSLARRTAWQRLYDELLSGVRVSLRGDEVTLEQALSRMYDADRDVRRDAAEAVTAGLASGLRTRALVLNTVLLDKATEDRLRSYPHWLASQNLANEMPDEAVEALLQAVMQRYDIPQRFYRLKARILGLPRLAHYDRYAPASRTTAHVAWDDAADVVLESFEAFDEEAGRIVGDFFRKRWIDAAVRADKMFGAYCMTRVPGVHPYVLMSYTGDRRSVMTLAHELGHGLHGMLAQERGVFDARVPLTLAETASVFGEALTFRALLEREQEPEARLDLLVEQIDEALGTVFRQVALNRYEDAIHNTRRDSGELSPDRLGELWTETQRAMMADAVDLDGYETWWSYIPHFVDVPGYVYAYAYGYLFSLAIYRKYEREGDAMVEPYLDLLRAGGSAAPVELAKIVGIDLTDANFWSEGLEAVDALLGEAEALAEETGALGAGG